LPLLSKIGVKKTSEQRKQGDALESRPSAIAAMTHGNNDHARQTYIRPNSE
jgi:hypothetical protein